MTTTSSGIVLRRLCDIVKVTSTCSASDQQLLQRFTNAREETAFEALVRRHGPLVLGVCRRVLPREQDAEDVFQATFLVLARKAGAVGRRASLGTWLYQVAYHMALKARKQAAARRQREERAARREQTDPLAEVSGRELLAVFDDELQALPEAERQALVLCYLEGKTRDEAARDLRCSESTIKRRIERGKERMRLRLARRGVVLSAALLAAGVAQRGRAAVPAALIGKAVAGIVSAQATALATGTIRAMTLGKLKALGGLAVAAALLGMGAVLLTSAPPESEMKEPKPTDAKAATPDNKNEMTVAGRVLNGDGKPLAGADIAVVAWPTRSHRGGDLSSGQPEVLGRTRSDADGRFRVNTPRTSSADFRGAVVLAGSDGHGVGWQRLAPDAEKPVAEIHLAQEQIIRGRFVDVQGQPAAGVTVRVGVVRSGKSGEVSAPVAGREPGCWPKAAVTDTDGRFEVRGVGRDMTAVLDVGDDRFATQGFAIETKAGAGDVVRTLEPAHLIEGIVTYADTGRPVPGARLTVYAGKDELDSLFGTASRADEKGRFRINPTPGKYFHVSAYAPDGEPYLTVQRKLNWPKAAVKQQLDLTLPRGVLVRGRVTEAGSGKTVAKAIVQFIPRRADNPYFRKDALTGWENTVVSGDDGRFDICILPGPGHLLIHAHAPDYIYAEIADGMLHQGKPGGNRYYAHAILPLDLKPDVQVHEVTARLKRAVTVKGKIVGPDGKPVAEALMLSRLGVDAVSSYWRGFPVIVQNGRFKLHGCHPEKTYPVCFLDARHRTGATVELSGKQVEEVTVRLTPCGEATTRLLDGDGKPMPNYSLWLELVVTPGPSQYDLKRLYEKGELAADAQYVGNIDHVNYRDGPFTDSEGRITFPALIPGATYRVVEVGARDDMIKCEFKAESGKTIRLADIVRKKQ